METIILTNGTLITKSKANELYKNGLRRLQISLDGNIKDGLANIMVNSEVLNNLRDFDKMKKNGCCEDVNYCRGCRAVAYAVTGNYLAKDPMCIKPFVKKEDIQPRVIKR